MSTLKAPSTHLSYEVNGDGSLVILIPGTRGEGEVFRQVAHYWQHSSRPNWRETVTRVCITIHS